jgi:hypothetical protein
LARPSGQQSTAAPACQCQCQSHGMDEEALKRITLGLYTALVELRSCGASSDPKVRIADAFAYSLNGLVPLERVRSWFESGPPSDQVQPRQAVAAEPTSTSAKRRRRRNRKSRPQRSQQESGEQSNAMTVDGTSPI